MSDLNNKGNVLLVLCICCGLVFFWFIFLNQFKFFKLGWNFSNQIEIFKPVNFFFWSSIYKKGKISLYIPLSYSLLFSLSSSWFILSPSYSTPSPKFPNYLVLTGIWTANLWICLPLSSPLDHESNGCKISHTCFSYQFFTPSPPHIDFNLFIHGLCLNY